MSVESRVVITAGARAAERRVLDEIEQALPPGGVAALPVVVVVPSHSLREHLLGRLVARRGAWLGLDVTTLAGLVNAILARSGRAPRSHEAIEPLLIRRLAARQGELARALGGLTDGYDAIAGAVRDLLDAGFEPAHLEALEERLQLDRAVLGGAAVGRAVAIGRVAAELWHELARLDLVPAAERAAEAARRLAGDADTSLPASRVVVHGFADATGVGSELLVALARHRHTFVVLDSPPALDGTPSEWRFGSRLRERLAGVASVEIDGSTPAPAMHELRRAADPAREARAAVSWLAQAPSAQAPELSALVARDLGDLDTWLRELDRQALAASARHGRPAAVGRRAAGLLELLRRGDDAPLGVALEVAREALEATTGIDSSTLRLAFAALCVPSLGVAATRAIENDSLALPVCDRLESGDDGEIRARRRRVEAKALSRAQRALARLRAAVATVVRPAPLASGLAALRTLLDEFLPTAERDELAAALEPLGDPALAALTLDGEELRRMVESAWNGLAQPPAGLGGGVAAMSVTEARGRTFDRLALLGLTRDRFPRAVRADPLLPDALRLRLRDLLPDLPVKAEGHDEERYLFAQALSAAERIALFRPDADRDGKPQSPSPLYDELLRAGSGAIRVEVDLPCSAFDLAVAAATDGDRHLEPPLAAALVEAGRRFGDAPYIEPASVASARLRLLRRRDADPANPSSRHLGPYLGAVGRVAAHDPRRSPPPVTALERFAACAWRTFLERVLRLAPLPELAESLPSLPRRLIGSVAHRVLEELAPRRAGLRLEAALTEAPLRVDWPSVEELEHRTRRAARRELAAAAIDPGLFEAPLVREALERLAVVRQVDWTSGAREILAVEAQGEADLVAAGAERRIPFRVDRVDRVERVSSAGDEIWLTDYKTGRPLSTAVRETTRSGHLARAVASGTALQLPIYLAGLDGRAARARYLNLVADLDDRARELALTREELPGLPLAAVLDSLFAAWDAGACAPRLLEADLRASFAGCASCEVREACEQGDTGARQRLARWAAAGAESDLASERATRAWWRLGDRPPAGGSSS